MSDKNMPAVEANEANKPELAAYEFAFHVLPTIAEGEVETVFKNIKDIITKHGEITMEEAPERFDLAYEVIKYLEGRNRKFTSAYFGWVRFTAVPTDIEELNQELEAVKELLRHLTIKLTKVEEENPFYFHEALESAKVEDVEVPEAVEAKPEEEKKVEVEAEKTEEDGEETEEKV